MTIADVYKYKYWTHSTFYSDKSMWKVIRIHDAPKDKVDIVFMRRMSLFCSRNLHTRALVRGVPIPHFLKTHTPINNIRIMKLLLIRAQNNATFKIYEIVEEYDDSFKYIFLGISKWLRTQLAAKQKEIRMNRNPLNYWANHPGARVLENPSTEQLLNPFL